ncbi:MAG TPA: hypothetical protein VMT20_27705 [Terriglobia bacterium]|nr:hypothetical protein [Terriglobia bacterium]
MTVVSIVFAILLMTLTLASLQFSPRSVVSFSKDLTAGSSFSPMPAVDQPTLGWHQARGKETDPTA